MKSGKSKAARGASLLAGALAFAVLAIINRAAAHVAERRHPPKGDFITVDGVRLHYSDHGAGQPVVLVHGNGVTGDDFNTSGLAGLLRQRHRVIIFDRPGFGYSDRPRGRNWTANAQADLIHRALGQLGVERPVVVGHSWGAIVALAMAVRHPRHVAGLALLSGYYFATLRPDVLLTLAGATPILGDVLGHTLLPVLSRLNMPIFERAIFSPDPVPQRFRTEYDIEMAVRPGQIRAASADGMLMIPSVWGMASHYRDITVPTAIMAGSGDKIVFARRAMRLHGEIRNSRLHVIPNAGHMIHYTATGNVWEAIEEVCEAAREPSPGSGDSAPGLRRNLVPTGNQA